MWEICRLHSGQEHACPISLWIQVGPQYVWDCSSQLGHFTASALTEEIVPTLVPCTFAGSFLICGCYGESKMPRWPRTWVVWSFQDGVSHCPWSSQKWLEPWPCSSNGKQKYLLNFKKLSYFNKSGADWRAILKIRAIKSWISHFSK